MKDKIRPKFKNRWARGFTAAPDKRDLGAKLQHLSNFCDYKGKKLLDFSAN